MVQGNAAESQLLYAAGVEAHARLQAEASTLLLRSHNADPSNLRSALVLFELFQSSGNQVEANEFANVVATLRVTATDDELEFADTVGLLALPNSEVAAASLEHYLKQNPCESFIWTAAARHFGAGGVLNGRRRFLALLDTVGCNEAEDIYAARRAFACHEIGEMVRAESLSREALSLHSGNGSATHSLLHVLYDTDRHEEGFAEASRWLSGAGLMSPMRPHIGWHAAIHTIALGKITEAEALLSNVILSPPTPRGSMVDGPILAWRLHVADLLSRDVRNSLRDSLAAVSFNHLTPLSATAVAFGLAATGEVARLRSFLNEVVGRTDEKFSVVVMIVRGLIAWVDADWPASEKWFAGAQEARSRIGGSLIHQELIERTREAASRRAFQ